jgi:hypothetical protein
MCSIFSFLVVHKVTEYFTNNGVSVLMKKEYSRGGKLMMMKSWKADCQGAGWTGDRQGKGGGHRAKAQHLGQGKALEAQEQEVRLEGILHQVSQLSTQGSLTNSPAQASTLTPILIAER